MNNPLPPLAQLLGLTLFSLSLTASPGLYAKNKEKPALLCEQGGQMKPCEDSQSGKVADKGKPHGFKAQASDDTQDKAKRKSKKKKHTTKKAHKAETVE
jgi:hypothetical protein